MIEAKEIKLVPLSEIKLNPKNRNKHPPDQIDRIVEIIKYQGFRRPGTISNQTGFLVCGEGRYLAAKKMGLKEMPVMYQDYEDEAQEYADGIADNAIDKWAELDKSLILQDTLELGPEFNFDMLGMKDFMLPEDFKTDEDSVPENVSPKTKLGDMYALGKHKLLCGDSTNIQHVEALLNGEKAEMAFTDPPYGVDYSGGIQFTAHGVKKDQRDKLEGDHSADIYTDVLPLLAQFVDGPIYTWYAASLGKQLYNAIDNLGDYHAMIVWVKDGGYGALNACYKQKHEPCVFWKPKGTTLRWNGPTTENTIWEMKKDKSNKLHPTQKPVELAERALSNHQATSVLDLFGGSGSTLIASEKTNRTCFMMEIDPRYCDTIVARWEQFTGKKAELINGNA